MEIIPGSNIEYYNGNDEKLRLSTFNDKLVLINQVEYIDNLCFILNTTIISQSNKLENTELNDTKTLDVPVALPNHIPVTWVLYYRWVNTKSKGDEWTKYK